MKNIWALLRCNQRDVLQGLGPTHFMSSCNVRTLAQVEIVFVSSDFSEEEALETYHQNREQRSPCSGIPSSRKGLFPAMT